MFENVENRASQKRTRLRDGVDDAFVFGPRENQVGLEQWARTMFMKRRQDRFHRLATLLGNGFHLRLLRLPPRLGQVHSEVVRQLKDGPPDGVVDTLPLLDESNQVRN